MVSREAPPPPYSVLMSVEIANQGIQAALENWIAALPFEGEGNSPGVMGDWIAIVCMVDVDPMDGKPKAQYYLTMRDGALLPHVAKGLLNEGMDQVEMQES